MRYASALRTIALAALTPLRHHHWVNPIIVGHDEQAVWTSAYTKRRDLWGKAGRKVDPTGQRADGRPIIDVADMRRRVFTTSTEGT